LRKYRRRVPDRIGHVGKTSWGDDVFRPDILAEALQKGQLALLLGAGVSRSLNLPLWHELVRSCATRAGLRSLARSIGPATPSETLRKAVDTIVDETRRKMGPLLMSLVSDSLYPAAFRKSGSYPTNVALDPLLVGLGSLVMNSGRGCVSEIVTLNFDDLLEWYLDLHGFSTQVVTEYPTLLRTDRDVRVYHPHGFVPLRTGSYQRSDIFVLSHEQYLREIVDDKSAWSLLLQNLFLSKVVLFVGTSVEDPDIQLLLKRAEPHLSDVRPFGYILLQRSELTARRKEELRRRNLEPLPVTSYKTAYLDLLRICQDAAGRVR